jgi:cell division protein FtsQ
MPVVVAADRRLRRARISPSRRRSWRRPWVTLAGVVLVALAATATAAKVVDMAVSSPALTITRLSIAGHARLSTGEVHVLLDGLMGSNLLTVDLDLWRRRLLAAPWVADATLRRVFPDAVSVVLTERRPAAIGRVDGVLYVIDHGGTIVAELGPDHADLDLPIIDGLATARSGALRVDERRAQLAGRLLRELQGRPDLARRVSQIDVEDARNAVLVLKDDTVLVRLGAERFAERLQMYLDLEPHLRERVDEIDSVDLRYGERVYVRPRTSRGAPASARGRRG